MLEGVFRRRRLPHWDAADAAYFVTTCLAGSIPARGLADIAKYREELEKRPRAAGISPEEWEVHKDKLVFARFDQWIDEEPVVRHLEAPEAATIVRDALYHFAGERYELIAFVVMPSHFHWLFHPRPEWCDAIPQANADRTPRERIMQSIKGFTAHRCNRLLGRRGAFWQDESYDHVVRNDEELLRIVEYIENNPVKAQLVLRPEDWVWSSAADRKRHNTAFGEVLRPRNVGQAF